MVLQSKAINKYDTYKDSGIEWIGQIPQEWGVRKIKTIADICGRIGFKGYTVNDLVDSDTEGAAIVLGGTNIMKDGYISYDYLTYISEFKYLESPEIMLNGGEILITKVGAGTGENAIYNYYQERVTINPNVMLCKPNNNNINSKYLNYFLISPNTKKEIYLESNKSGAQPAINQNYIKNLHITYPPFNEQQQIADYLDKKCGEIDRVVETEKAVIERLKEYKQSVINEAVTKGLDKSVPLKDSGIEWIGKIPQHWEIWKLSRLTKQIIDGTHSTPTYVNKGIPFLRVTDISTLQNINDDIDFENVMYIPEHEHEELSKRCKPEKGDLLVSKNGSIGIPKIVNWDSEFSIFVSLCLIKITSKVLVGYLYYYFKSTLIWTEIAIGGKTGTITNLHLDKIKEFKIPLPNIDEQDNIINYLDKKCSEIDKAISDKEKLIEKLTEYKKSLIYECVTGKRKVI